MPRSLITILVLVGITAGGWFFNKNYEVRGLENVTVRARQTTLEQKSSPSGYQSPAVTRKGENIRIASFNIQVLGVSKVKKKHVLKILAKVIRRFDVVAIQEIRAKQYTAVMRELLDHINAEGRQYDYVIGPRMGHTVSKEQYAFIFDKASIEVDRAKTYTAPVAPGLLHRAPLVCLFRVRGPPVDQAFTFKLINIHTDPDETKTELNALDDVFYTVSNNKDNEDDIILLGDLNVDDKTSGRARRFAGNQLGHLGRSHQHTWNQAVRQHRLLS